MRTTASIMPAAVPIKPSAGAATRAILDMIDQVETPVTARWLQKELQAQAGLGRDVIKGALAALIEKGVLAYSLACGRSVVVRSYGQPVHITPHIVIKPPRCTCAVRVDTVVIDLAPGAAFGGGQHPTTRLALQAIDDLFYHKELRPFKQPVRALDLGTGCGVLGLALLKLGTQTVVGVDKDAIACYEARHNARLNQMAARFGVVEGVAEDITGSFDLVAANLRYPTLCRLKPRMLQWLEPSGRLILSGIKNDEAADVLLTYQPEFTLLQSYQAQGWTAISIGLKNAGIPTCAQRP